MDTAIVTALIGVIGVLVGVWIGGIISRKSSREAIAASNDNAIKLMRRQEFNSASLKLRDSFKDEILALNPAHTIIKDDLPAFLWGAFPKHESAIYDFSFFLNTKRKAAFYKAWQEYYCHKDAQNENTVPFLEQYSCMGLTIGQIHDMKNLLKSRLEAILKFTENI